MSEAEYSIDDLKIQIQAHWGNIRNEENVLAGIEKAFKHLDATELQELWIFIRDHSDEMKNPSATGVYKLAKDHNFKIRRTEANRIESRVVCGHCGSDNGLTQSYCKECNFHLSHLPKKCRYCSEPFKDPTVSELETIQKTRKILDAVPLKCAKCGKPRQAATIKRIMI